MAGTHAGYQPWGWADRPALVVLAKRKRGDARRGCIVGSPYRTSARTPCRRLVGVWRRHRLRLDRPRPGLPSSERCPARLSNRYLPALQRLHGGRCTALPRHLLGQRRTVAHVRRQDQALLAALLGLPGPTRSNRSAVM